MQLPPTAFPSGWDVQSRPPLQVARSTSNVGILAGSLGIGFGLLGIFSIGLIFVPLAALCSFFGFARALGAANAPGVGLSLLGGLLTIFGAMVSPTVWALVAGGFLATHSGNGASLQPLRTQNQTSQVSDAQWQSAPRHASDSIRKSSQANASTSSAEGPVPKCEYGIVQRMPGYFVDQRFAQEVRVRRVAKSSSVGQVCTYEVGIADAENILLSGDRVHLWEGHAQGQVFRDGSWFEPEPHNRVKISTFRLPALPRNLVVVRQAKHTGVERLDRLKLIGFAGSEPRTLLDVAAPSRLDLGVDGEVLQLKIWQRGECPDCAPTKVIRLVFDQTAQQLALLDSNEIDRALYRGLRQYAVGIK